jgi:hypothetical protein
MINIKFNFTNYLEVVEGMTWNYFDDNYSDKMAEDIYQRFDKYDTSNWENDVQYFIEHYEEYC